MPDVHVFPTPEALAEAAASRIAAALREAVAARGRASLVLTGGSTPDPTYRRLAQGPAAPGSRPGQAFDWHRVHVFWGDERCVPPEHAESNYRLARETFLHALAIPEAHVHRIACEDDPAEGVRRYEAALDAYFGDDEALFDVTLLGLGEDGHVASLFPGAAAVSNPSKRVMATEAPPSSPIRRRMTLTLLALNASRLVLFLVTGERKRSVLRRVLEGAGPELPATRVRPAGALAWYVDEAAYGDPAEA